MFVVVAEALEEACIRTHSSAHSLFPAALAKMLPLFAPSARKGDLCGAVPPVAHCEPFRDSGAAPRVRLAQYPLSVLLCAFFYPYAGWWGTPHRIRMVDLRDG